jgi:hypothetical protein
MGAVRPCLVPRAILAGCCLAVFAASAAPAAVACAELADVGDLLDVEGVVVATRTRAPDGGWSLPTGDAVLVDGEWWSPVGDLVPVPAPPPATPLLRRVVREGVLTGDPGAPSRLVGAAMGDVTADGEDDLVISFRRPFRRTFINTTRPRRTWIDARGLSAHVGVYRPATLEEEWVAGTLLHPVVQLAACDGALAVAYGRLRAPGVFATGAWRWLGFGFLTAGLLPGAGRPVCVDVDRDGRTEPAIVGRTGP